ncbi:MAG: penicillin-binding protein 1C [Rhodobacterales bacterium]|nr:penicillin-binding protein 1C [Rhodobacterales bacterium]
MSRLLSLLAAVLFVAAVGFDTLDQWVAETELPPLISDTSVEVRDRTGVLLRAHTVENGRWRLGVQARDVDPGFIAMLIAYEDRRFYSHSGVDGRAMMRAFAQAIWNRRVVSGGSTLTMQVARLLEDSGTGKWAGKLRQIRVALALERRLNKQEILTLYLINAPYGSNLEGIRAATLAYFNKEPRRLTPAQSALLVAIPQSPEARRPDRNRQIARAARDRVLARMRLAGAIDSGTEIAALAEPVPAERRPFPALARHLSDRVIAANPVPRRHDLTLDARVQIALEQLAKTTLQNRAKTLSIALLVADYQTGEIIASVGSAGIKNAAAHQGFVDMTQALRSPGSTLKPLVYAMAIDHGLVHPQTLIDDRPISIAGYAPQNFDGKFRGEIRVVDALPQSLNIPVVLLTQELGPPRLMAALRRAGTAPMLPSGKPGLAVALGGVGITLQDLVQLFGGLANGGKSVDLHWQDRTLTPSQTIISRSAAWQVSDILAGIPPPKGAMRQRLAYKTGTSYGNRDAWAIGFDGRHVAGVWLGRPDGTPVPGIFGGDLAAPVLFNLFGRLKPTLDPFVPPPPETLLLSTANLPQPLQRFRPRNAVFSKPADAPDLSFPPDGALIALEGADLTAKVRNGIAPFTWLANGRAVLTQSYMREVTLPDLGLGFTELSVIDAKGRTAKALVRLE